MTGFGSPPDHLASVVAPPSAVRDPVDSLLENHVLRPGAFPIRHRPISDPPSAGSPDRADGHPPAHRDYVINRRSRPVRAVFRVRCAVHGPESFDKPVHAYDVRVGRARPHGPCLDYHYLPLTDRCALSAQYARLGIPCPNSQNSDPPCPALFLSYRPGTPTGPLTTRGGAGYDLWRYSDYFRSEAEELHDERELRPRTGLYRPR
jgi:hypothetical protein